MKYLVGLLFISITVMAANETKFSNPVIMYNTLTLPQMSSSGVLTNSSAGLLSSTATSALTVGTATNATNATVTQKANNASYFPTFVSSSTTGSQSLNLATGFSINPSTDVVTATTFSGALSGNATTSTTATNATNVNVTQKADNSTYFPTFVSSSTSGNQSENLSTGISINPSTDVVTATTFSGALSGNATSATTATTATSATTATTATNATNISTTATTTNGTFFPIIVASPTNSNQASSLMTGFSFNPANDVVVAGNYVTSYQTFAATGVGSDTLTVASPGQAFFTGTSTGILTLPVASTLQLGQSYFVVNNSTGIVTVRSSGSTTLKAMAASTYAWFSLIKNSATDATSWSVEYSGAAPVFSGLTQWGAIYASTTTAVSSTAQGASGDVLIAKGAAAPTWQGAISSYTPTFTGMGTPTGVSFRFSQVGKLLYIWGSFTTGTASGVIAKVSLPAGFVSDASLPTPCSVGNLATGLSNVTANMSTLVEPNASTMELGFSNTTNGDMNETLDTVWGAGVLLSISAVIPVQ